MQIKLIIYSKLIALIISMLIFSKAMAYEEPKYTVIKENKIYEIRHYTERVAVQVTYNYDGNGFRKLFNYISGANTQSQKVKMTTPVTESTKIAMTIPVTQTEENNQRIMQFYLPSKFTINSAPIPTDPKVELITIPEGYFAVIEYSGRSTDKRFIKYKEILKEKLIEDSIEINGIAIKATYNGPFTLPILRRNEAMFKIIWQ
ncbi:MAG: hypothetical protein CFH15_01426 [Alphaproteobacteria bacterium MarineAlpha5_Bin5]|nr:MAG: hypothetical protein CFH15_01426 [Alphaproteobacteria bacterium MarineAlpha5_Bin5]PPR50004.1 MAG: hypothetical protein CFH14_00943 [Alphaproteobacteria bacterium MarineAlpha5_Bin4]|tara:strand:- start:3342 stop:3950 length:609 start_codon:yes stop_codon:yes gene_type:complete